MKFNWKNIFTWIELIFYLSPIIIVSLIPILGWITNHTTLIFMLIIWFFIYYLWLTYKEG
jgi:hypothetical protein